MVNTTQRPYPNLKTWRKAQGLNQRDASKLLGIPQASYSRLERGKNAASGRRALGIMEITGVPLEILVGATS